MKHGQLVYDSCRAGITIGTRGVGLPDRSLLFASGDLRIDLMIPPVVGGAPLIFGQVRTDGGRVPVAGAVVVLGNGRPAMTTDDRGQFTLVGPDECLRIRAAGQEIVCAIPSAEDL